MASPPCSPHSNRCRKEAAGIKGNALGMGRPISAKTEIHQVCFAELKDRAVEAMEIHGNRYVIEHHQRGVSHIHLLPDEHVGARGVSMEIDSSGGSASSAALKSHVFCVPHNGIETLSEGLGTFGVNKGVSKTFTLQFIGEGSVSVALRNQGRFNHVVGIDVELCLQWLAYQKAAGYPDIVPGKLFDIRHSSKM